MIVDQGPELDLWDLRSRKGVQSGACFFVNSLLRHFCGSVHLHSCVVSLSLSPHLSLSISCTLFLCCCLLFSLPRHLLDVMLQSERGWGDWAFFIQNFVWTDPQLCCRGAIRRGLTCPRQRVPDNIPQQTCSKHDSSHLALSQPVINQVMLVTDCIRSLS